MIELIVADNGIGISEHRVVRTGRRGFVVRDGPRAGAKSTGYESGAR
jgi:hypothetical protein